ncbi:hypothetical protein [Pseudomonas sp. DTU12.3]|uniref:hypothetical protein n=1 Tax=Pseudomonas sp. DTU12.3 TaxID=2073078 RepID=UPI00211499D5|nr:hypothetical protein [Pseudomonas sp. DTU12.3]
MIRLDSAISLACFGGSCAALPNSAAAEYKSIAGLRLSGALARSLVSEGVAGSRVDSLFALLLSEIERRLDNASLNESIAVVNAPILTLAVMSA